jgi:hypothetical protein
LTVKLAGVPLSETAVVPVKPAEDAAGLADFSCGADEGYERA